MALQLHFLIEDFAPLKKFLFQGCIPWSLPSWIGSFLLWVHNVMDDLWTMDDVSTLEIVSTCTLRTCGCGQQESMAPATAGFWRVCSWNPASAAASWNQNLHMLHHLHRFLRLSTSILIHPENTGWRWLKKVFTGLLVQVAKRFQVSVSSGECVGDQEWTP